MVMNYKFTLWQMEPYNPTNSWIYMGMIYAENQIAAMDHFMASGTIYSGYEYVITISI